MSEDNEPQNLQAELPAQEALSTFLRGMVDHMHTHQGLARTLATLMTARSGALTEGQSRPGGSRHRPDRPRSARRRRPRRCGCRCRHDGAARHQRGPRPPRLASRRRRLHHLGTGRATPAAPLMSSAGPSDSPKGTPGAAPRARSTIACGTVSRSAFRYWDGAADEDERPPERPATVGYRDAARCRLSTSVRDA